MALASNTAMTFTRYVVEDGGIRLWFIAADPGPGEATDYDILLTDSELAGVSTNAQLRTLVTTKLQRKLRAQGIATRLDPFIGQTITV